MVTAAEAVVPYAAAVAAVVPYAAAVAAVVLSAAAVIIGSAGATQAAEMPGKGVSVQPLKSSIAEETFQTLLVIESQLLSARNQLVGAEADRATAFVRLTQALGGGWSDLDYTLPIPGPAAGQDDRTAQ